MRPGSKDGTSNTYFKPCLWHMRRGFANPKHTFEKLKDRHIPYDQPKDRRPLRYKKRTYGGEKNSQGPRAHQANTEARAPQSSHNSESEESSGMYSLDSSANLSHLRRKHHGILRMKTALQTRTDTDELNQCTHNGTDIIST